LNLKFSGLQIDSKMADSPWGMIMARRFAPLDLDKVGRAELTSLASRRSTAQGLALRARIIRPGLKANS